MTTNHINDRIQEYIDGKLSHAEETTIHKHIATCTQCAGELADMETLVRNIRRMKEGSTLPEGFCEETDLLLRAAMLQGRRNGHGRTTPVIPITPRMTWYLAAAAVVLIAALCTIFIPRTAAPPVTTADNTVLQPTPSPSHPQSEQTPVTKSESPDRPLAEVQER